MKKLLALFLTIVLATGVLTSCGVDGTKTPPAPTSPDFSKIYFDAKENVKGSEHLVGSPEDEDEFKVFLGVYFLYVIENNRQRSSEATKQELVDGSFRLEVYWSPGKAENLTEEALSGLNAESMYKDRGLDDTENTHYKIWISWKKLDADAIMELTANDNVEMIRFYESDMILADD